MVRGQHVPVDFIAGTSMGVWSEASTPPVSASGHEDSGRNTRLGRNSERPHTYQDLSFLRKQDQRAYPNSLVIGLRRVCISRGLNAGHQIGLLIDRETLLILDCRHSTRCPSLSLCIYDLVSGKQFVFKDGSLAEALRATMSIPGAFTPCTTASESMSMVVW